MVEDMPVDVNCKNTITVEQCDIFGEHGFTVVAFAANNKTGKFCALRKSDYLRFSLLNKLIIKL